jgi:nitrous oxidase accessory protein NosD
VGGAAVRPESGGVSYTLRGRLESRLAASLAPFAAACVVALFVGRWWPLELAGIMVAVGIALDAAVWHRLLPYQPGWAAVPLGLAELAVVMALAWALDVTAPLRPAILFFALAWLAAQALAHAVLPLLHLPYGDDGGELGRAGRALTVAPVAAVAGVLGVAWVTQPPLVRLEAGVHSGPLVLDHAQRLVGDPGAVVRGGIRITADDVSVRNVAVLGGEIGIEVRDSKRVVLDDVRILGATLDGINVRRSAVTIRDCYIEASGSPHAQGIDLSFGMDAGHSVVEDCTVRGGQEGIATNMVMATLRRNRISGTSMRGITMTEMSMGDVEENEVEGALGVGIFCGDYSHCAIERNVVRGTRPDADGGRSRAGYAIQADYFAHADLDENTLHGNARGVGAFVNARVTTN